MHSSKESLKNYVDKIEGVGKYVVHKLSIFVNIKGLQISKVGSVRWVKRGQNLVNIVSE